MANPKSPEARQAFLDQNPFNGFQISDNTILGELKGRHPCPKCGKSRKFFCYTCYVPIKELENQLPVVELPIKVDIIKHRHEIDGKSTAGHAAILASDYVRIYTYPNIPCYENERVVLVYPSRRAVGISQLFNLGYEEILSRQCYDDGEDYPKGFHPGTLLKKLPKNNVEDNLVKGSKVLPINRVIFIDSTWNQSKGIYKDERINWIPCVVIQNRISQFWRHQKGSPRWYLATIEAIHQFVVEVHLHCWGLNPDYRGIINCFTEDCLEGVQKSFSSRDKNSYDGQYDNMLFFFQHMYGLIHTYYQHEDLIAYKRELR